MDSSKSSTIKKWFHSQLCLGNPSLKDALGDLRSLCCGAFCNLTVGLAIWDIWCLVEGSLGLIESFLTMTLFCFESF